MTKMIGPRKIHRYGNEFKATAVKLSHLPGVRAQDVAEALDIQPFMRSLRIALHYISCNRDGNLRGRNVPLSTRPHPKIEKKIPEHA